MKTSFVERNQPARWRENWKGSGISGVHKVHPAFFRLVFLFLISFFYILLIPVSFLYPIFHSINSNNLGGFYSRKNPSEKIFPDVDNRYNRCISFIPGSYLGC
jgi:hypothetical protein